MRTRYLRVDMLCTYEGALASLVGQQCRITKISAPLPKRLQNGAPKCLALFLHDRRERVVELRNLIPVGETPMSKLVNFKTMVQTAIANLLKPLDADSAKEQAVRRLGVASEIVRLGEADKKKAKAELTKLGIITGGEQNGVVFDSARYVVTATTKAASSRLDAAALDAALDAEGLSGAMKRRIIAAATITNKAATSFAVEAK